MLTCLKIQMKKQGFTLIELLVVISIIAIISGVVLVNYRPGQQGLDLQRAASKLASDIRRVQEMATSTREYTGCSGGVFPTGYGIVLDSNQQGVYYIFADCNDNQVWDFDADETVEAIPLGEGITIDDLSGPVRFLDIIFTSPDPTTTICECASAIGCSCSPSPSAWIRLINEDGQTKTVNINQVGRVEVD